VGGLLTISASKLAWVSRVGGLMFLLSLPAAEAGLGQQIVWEVCRSHCLSTPAAVVDLDQLWPAFEPSVVDDLDRL
jgi:hypothetical protein